MYKILFLLVFLQSLSISYCYSKCTPEFPYKDKWLGGDGIYSVQLTEKKTLWIFGDSFVSRDNIIVRNQQTGFVPNSIAISTCNNGKWDINYFWGNQFLDLYKQKGFFREESCGYKLWPKDGFLYKGKLYVLFDQVETLASGDVEGLGFGTVGTTMVIVDNPLDAPVTWSMKYHEFMKSDVLFPGVSIVKEGEFAYFFSVLSGTSYPTRPVTIIRKKLDDLVKKEIPFEYLSKTSNDWEKNIDIKDLKMVFENGGTEMSVRYHSDQQQYVAIFGEPMFFSPYIIKRTTKKLKNDWSLEVKIGSFSEMNVLHLDYTPNVFCYAAKEHIKYYDVQNSCHLITYACNSMEGNDVMVNTNLYRPIVVNTCQ